MKGQKPAIVVAALLGLGSILGGCTPLLDAFFTPKWDTASEAKITSATFCCGFVPYLLLLNYVPDAQIWGDGRIVWTEHDENGHRQVWQGSLTAAQLTQLFVQAHRAGFFGWNDLYRDPRVADASTQCLRINLQDRAKEVCEYFTGAPEAFHTLYDFIQGGAGAVGQTYAPDRGWLIAHPLDGFQPEAGMATLEWSVAQAGMSLQDAVDGVWVEGATLAWVWDVVNTNPWANFVRDGGSYYQISLQVPGLNFDGPATP